MKRGDAALPLARLLEEGNGDELRRWVTERAAECAAPGGDEPAEPATAEAEAILAAWLAERGGRELSYRSRAFWELVLDTPSGPSHPLAEALWPLASPGP